MFLWSPDARGYDLTEINLAGSYMFMMPLLQRARLDKANLYQAKLLGTQLQNASLRDANLREAVLIGVNFDGADITDADLAGSTVLFPSQGIPPQVFASWEPHMGPDGLHRLRRRMGG